jgi:hypothetical protein
MQEPHSEGVATRADLESCAGGGDIAGEALTEALAGWAIEPRNPEFRAPTLWTEGEGHILRRAIASGAGARRGRRTPARQETPCTRTGMARRRLRRSAGRWGKAQAARPTRTSSRSRSGARYR